MKFIWTIILTFICGHILACESRYQIYQTECSITDKFNDLNKGYKDLKLDPLHLKETVLPLIYGEVSFQYDKYNIIHQGQNNAQKDLHQSFAMMFPFIKNFNPSIITMENIEEIHRKISTTNPGKLRSLFGITKPKNSYSCVQNALTTENLAILNSFDVLDDENMPMIEINSLDKCATPETFRAEISFLKGAKVKSELEHWLIDFNDALNRYENGNSMNVSPYEYLNQMNRWFQSIHPFNDKNEEISFYLSFYATNRLHLAPIFFDVKSSLFLKSKESSYKSTLQTTNKKIANLDSCLFEIIDTHMSEECVSL